MNDKSKYINTNIKEKYHENGFVHIKNFLTYEEIQLYRNETEKHMVGYDWPVAQYAGIRKNMQINNKFFSTELFHGNFRPLLTYLVLDADDDEEEEKKTLSTFNDGLVESTCAYFDKPIDISTTVEPHRDGGGPMDGITLWIALDPATVDNGCLWYVPGSHRNLDEKEFFTLLNKSDNAKEKKFGIPIEVEAGDAIIHGSKCIHYSEKSIIRTRRRAISFFYWSKLSVERIENLGQQIPGGRARL